MKFKIVFGVLFLSAIASSVSAMAAETRTVAVPPTCPAPPYPNTSIRFDQPPIVVLEFLLDPNGAVLRSKVVATSGARIFDEAARIALSRCIYAPLKHGGWVRVSYRWVLD